MKIGIVTDSTCNLSREIIEALGSTYVPLYLKKEEKYVKATEVDSDEYIKYLAKTEVLPTTSQPSPKDFLDSYEKMKASCEALIVPVISDKLSGTFDSASLAAGMTDMKVRVIDSKLTSYALGFLVMNLAKKINEGFELEQLSKYAETFYKKVTVFFSVDNLMYLSKGGRIGKAKALMGNLLKMKPILNIEEGELRPVENARGSIKLLKRLFEKSTLEQKNKRIKRIYILQCNRLEEASKLETMVKAEVPEVEVKIVNFENVVLTHLGPSAIGIITETE